MKILGYFDAEWEVDMMFQNLYVPQHGGFFTIRGKVLAHKHRVKNKKR